MGEVVQFHKLSGVRCPACEKRLAYDQESNSLECRTEGCGEGYLRSDDKMKITIKEGYTLIETR